MDPAAVKAHLERVVSSETFSRSARARELLRYVVEEALAGRGDAINSKTIAQDVFGRDETFDASTDPLVRVQMGRTRATLGSYYEKHPDAEMRITIPKGAYKPVFVPGTDETGADAVSTSEAGDAPVDAESKPARARLDAPTPTPLGTLPTDLGDRFAERPAPGASRRRRLRFGPAYLGAAALVALLLAVAVPLLRGGEGPGRGRDYPVVVVRPFENMTGEATNEGFEKGFQRQIASDLQRFRTVRIAIEDEPQEAIPPPKNGVQTRGPAVMPDYAVSGSILSVVGELDVVLNLTELATGEVVMRERLRRQAGDGTYYDLLAELSSRATGRLLGAGGGVEEAERSRQVAAMGLPTAAEVPAFRCLVLFDEMTNAKSPQSVRGAYDCLTTALANGEQDASLMAALAWTITLAAPEAGQVELGPWADELTIAQGHALAARAVAIAPGNDVAHQQLGIIEWRQGEKTNAISSLRRAVALNPGNPGHLADLALFLGFTGEWPESKRLVARALERSGNPPSWYEMPLFYRALIRGDAKEARRVAARNAEGGDPYADIYRLAAAVMVGDADEVAALRPVVEAIATRNGGDPLRAARPWIRSDEVLGALEDRLAEAGIEITAS